MQETTLTLLFEPIALTVFKKLLLSLKSDFLGEGECVSVLYSFLLVARVQPYIEIEILSLADMLYLVFRLSSDSPELI